MKYGIQRQVTQRMMMQIDDVCFCFQFATTSSDDSSSCDSESIRMTRRGGYRPGIRMGTLRELSHSDPDYTSSSEQSCDTVIYRGPSVVSPPWSLSARAANGPR